MRPLWYRQGSMPPMLELGEAAILFTQVGVILQRLEDRAIGMKPDSAPLPRGVLTCGEAWFLLPVLFALIAEKFPQLSDPDQLSELLAHARMESACGLPN